MKCLTEMISISIRTSGIRRKIIENKLRTHWTYECNARYQNLLKNTEKEKKITEEKPEERVGNKIAQAIEDPLLVSEKSLLYIRKMKLNTNRQINVCLLIDALRGMRSQKPKRVRNFHRFRALCTFYTATEFIWPKLETRILWWWNVASTNLFVNIKFST